MRHRPSYFQRAQHKRYESRSFQNPYFRPKEPRRWVGYVIGTLCLAGTIGGAWALLSLPAFAYETVHVEGTETIASADVEREVRTYLDTGVVRAFRRSNRFLFDADALRERLSSAFPFDRVSVETTGKGIDVRVRERQSELLWRSADRLWLVDLQGVVIRALTPEETAGVSGPAPAWEPGTPMPPLLRLKRLQTFVDVNAEAVTVGGNVLSPAEVTGIRRVQDRLLDLGVPFTETRVDRVAGQRVAIRALTGYDILVDPLGDPDAQADRLAAVLRDTVKQPKTLEYVDLRFGDHVYYK